MANETTAEGPEGLAPVGTTPSPTWGPPRAPLPPHRLAALANALGVSTPSPAQRPSPSFMSSSSSYPGTSTSASFSDREWRSPTPSSTSTHGFSSYQPSTSKFLLHVTPPLHLPHESNSVTDSSTLTPPPSTASGYHTQFRRGTLVPLHPTLQSQMVAIAKEYALPSTAGILLYLVSSSTPRSSPAPPSDADMDDEYEPGPRLSEEIWKHLWTRVLKAEREETLAANQSPSNNYGLGLGLGMKNSPYASQDALSQPQPLRPLFSPSLRQTTPQQHHASNWPMTPSPSTPSTTSDMRSNGKSVAPSFSSRSQSQQSEPDTPDTSSGSHAGEHDVDLRAEALHLPGLHSPSIIPILAKVEFDIDRRKAGWYEPWLRSRRVNQLKRTGSRKGTLEGDDKSGRIQLKLAGRITDGNYKPLSDSPEIATVELDPLEETKSSEQEEEEEEEGSVYEDETGDLLTKMDRPRLSVDIPETGSKRTSEPTTAGTIKKRLPPPLVLAPDGSPLPSAMDSSHLAYLRQDAIPEDALSPEGEVRSRTPIEEKRDGAVFDELDLGLDYSYDENDPHDRRKSQFIMKAKLDEIERTLAQFSPKRDPDNGFVDAAASSTERLVPDSATPPRKSPSGSPLRPDDSESWPSRTTSLKAKAKKHTVRYETAHNKAKLSEEDVPAVPAAQEWPERSTSAIASKKKQNRNTFKLEGNTVYNIAEAEAAWPLPPRSAPAIDGKSDFGIPPLAPSPPRLALNGVQAPKPQPPQRKVSDPKEAAEKETAIWKRAVQGDKSPMKANTPLSSPPSRQDSVPVIPLSPDPFGRFASNTMEPPSSFASSSSKMDGKHKNGTNSSISGASRFSTDSATHEEAITKEKGGLVSVKSVRNLWRKSKKPSISGQAPPNTGRPSLNLPPPLPGTHGQQSNMPEPPRSPRFPPAQVPQAPSPVIRHNRVDSALDHFHFDQESPYPLPKSSSTRNSPRPSTSSDRPPSPSPPAPSAPDRSSIRKSILKSFKGPGGSPPQPQGALLEPRPSTERRPSGESSRGAVEPLKPRRPSVLDVAATMRASSDLPPPSPVLPNQYLQNGRVPGLAERRKSAKPKTMSNSPSTGSPPQRPPLLGAGAGTSPPKSMISVASSRESEDQASFDASQFEMVNAKADNSLSYPYTTLDQDGLR